MLHDSLVEQNFKDMFTPHGRQNIFNAATR